MNQLTQTFQDIADAIRTKGIAGTMSPLEMANNISLIALPLDQYPKGVCIDGVKWDETWEAKGAKGTIVDIVVGDEITPRLDVALYASNISNTNKSTIDWGDGNTSTVTMTSESTMYDHTYATAGHYVITIDNNASTISFVAKTSTAWYYPRETSAINVSLGNMRSAVRRVRQYGSALKKLIYCFANCIYLNSPEGGYPDELPPFPPGLTTISAVYAHCIYYSGHIPYIAHLTQCTNVENAFIDCRKMQGTCQVFPPRITTCANCYCQCLKLSAIPHNIFPEENANTLLNMNSVFKQIGLGIVKPQQAFPKLDHLTKCTVFANAFYEQRLCFGPMPKLPTSAQNCKAMFYFNLGYMEIDEDYFDGVPITTMETMFQGCQNLHGKCPRIPSTCVLVDSSNFALRGIFKDCFVLGGTFPTLPSNYTGDMSSIFNGCKKISGPLPDIPQKVTNLTSAFFNCMSATGRCPSLGHLDNLNSGTMVNQLFYGCELLTDPPLTFLDASKEKIKNLTSFSEMFHYCKNLKECVFDLSGFTKVTNVQYMFKECHSLTHGPTKLPPNVTTIQYLFSHCFILEDDVLPLGDYASLTNISFSYQFTWNIKPLHDENGDIELRKEKYLSTKVTACTSAMLHTSVDVQKLYQDVCLAFGKDKLWVGCENILDYSYCVEYKGGIY